MMGALGSLSAVASGMIDSETCSSMRTQHNAWDSISFPGVQFLLLEQGDGLGECFLFQCLKKSFCAEFYLFNT